MAPVSPQLAYGAYWLWMETAVGSALTQLDRRGIPGILLKGPAIARWLYVDEVRYSRDIDLLVSPARFDDAQAALAEIGYEVPLAGAPSSETGPNTNTLIHPNGIRIDLHHRLIGTPADPPEHCWRVLSQRTVPFPLVTGTVVRALDVQARTMHLALHVAQNGPGDAKPLADLERGLAQVGRDDWKAAAALAIEARALRAFAEGLRACPAGREMATALGLPETARDLELELRMSSAPFESLFFARLADTEGLGPKAALIGRKLWPTPEFMRMNFEVARRGRLGLLAAHAQRPWSLMRRSRPAITAWRKAQGRLRAGSPGDHTSP